MSDNLSVDRQEILFNLFSLAKDNGVDFAKISQVDELIAQHKSALFLKHDIHGLNLDKLVDFAKREKDMGILGTYYFMPSGHPVTIKHYDFEAQIDAMKEIKAMGHELGLHIDPYFQIFQKEKPLSLVMRDILDEFLKAGIELKYANMHGNSRHKHMDNNGYGTSFDLFAEVGRQQDYPTLGDVPKESAELIRANRINLADFGITHWGDMPICSEKNGFIITNFMTDNRLGKMGTLELLIREKTSGSYCLAPAQPPGSRNIDKDYKSIEISSFKGIAKPFHEHIIFDGDAPKKISSLLKTGTPLLFLVHPEFYCES